MPSLLHSFRVLKWPARLCVIATLCIVIAWLHGLFWFAGQISDHNLYSNTKADAIVVLTGGSKRVEEGLNLLKTKQSNRLFISGVHDQVGLTDLLKINGVETTDIPCCIELGYEAHNTKQNAEEVYRWTKRNKFKSIRLVTSNYHMPRAKLYFDYHAPELTIIPHAVFPDTYPESDWWDWPRNNLLILMEYNKFLFEWLTVQI